MIYWIIGFVVWLLVVLCVILPVVRMTKYKYDLEGKIVSSESDDADTITLNAANAELEQKSKVSNKKAKAHT